MWRLVHRLNGEACKKVGCEWVDSVRMCVLVNDVYSNVHEHNAILTFFLFE